MSATSVFATFMHETTENLWKNIWTWYEIRDQSESIQDFGDVSWLFSEFRGKFEF